MTSTTISRAARAAGLVAALGTIGCLGDSVDPDAPITIDPTRVTVLVGDTATVTARVPSRYGTISYDWFIGDTSRARVVRSDASGRVFVRGVAPGSTELAFTLTTAIQTVTGTVPITVNAR